MGGNRGFRPPSLPGDLCGFTDILSVFLVSQKEFCGSGALLILLCFKDAEAEAQKCL